MATSLRDTILAVKDYKVEPVEVPEWGITVYVRTISGHEWYTLATTHFPDGKVTKPDELMFDLVSLTLCDAEGKRLFTKSDIPALKERSLDVIVRLFNASMALNKMGSAHVEQLAKN